MQSLHSLQVQGEERGMSTSPVSTWDTLLTTVVYTYALSARISPSHTHGTARPQSRSVTSTAAR